MQSFTAACPVADTRQDTRVLLDNVSAPSRYLHPVQARIHTNTQIQFCLMSFLLSRENIPDWARSTKRESFA